MHHCFPNVQLTLFNAGNKTHVKNLLTDALCHRKDIWKSELSKENILVNLLQRGVLEQQRQREGLQSELP